MAFAFQSFRAKKSEIAQVIAPYAATTAEQLSLSRGQLIMIRKKTDSGWWEGELQAKGRKKQVGWFPATYVKVLQGGRNSGRNTPVSASRCDLHETILGERIWKLDNLCYLQLITVASVIESMIELFVY